MKQRSSDAVTFNIAADVLGVCADTLYRWSRQTNFPFFREGRFKFVSLSAAREWLNNDYSARYPRKRANVPRIHTPVKEEVPPDTR